jgi:hypothetical protein
MYMRIYRKASQEPFPEAALQERARPRTRGKPSHTVNAIKTQNAKEQSQTGVTKMKKLEYTVSFTTPAFLGNAEQQTQWRTPPFKGENNE